MVATWTVIAATQDDGVQLDDTLVNGIIDNINFVHDPPADLYALSIVAANITTTSTSFVDLTGFSITITTQGNPVRIKLNVRANSTNMRFDFQVDGVTITGDTDGLGAVTPASTFGANAIERIVDVAAGSHTFKVQWRVTTGTGTLYAAGLPQFTAEENVSANIR